MQTEQLQDGVFKALADPTRRAIISMLTERSATVTDLVSHFDISQPAISQQLRVLRECGLVVERKQGRHRIYTLETGPLEAAREWLDRHVEFWTSRLENLGQHLRRTHGKKP
jgi:DNA-binding transcriptional ArsR family regulator